MYRIRRKFAWLSKPVYISTGNNMCQWITVWFRWYWIVQIAPEGNSWQYYSGNCYRVEDVIELYNRCNRS